MTKLDNHESHNTDAPDRFCKCHRYRCYVYLIQKSVERSYTRQIEEFKATLQYSNFEQQTKFARLHAKRVEVLETLYQKFIIYKVDFYNMIADAQRVDFVDEQGKTRVRKNIGVDELIKQIYGVVAAKIKENDLKFQDFKMCFENNRIFLPDFMCSEIDGILSTYHKMEWAMQILLEDVPDEFLPFAIDYIKDLFEIEIDLCIERPKFIKLIRTLMRKLNDEVESQAATLEQFYRSVAYTTD